MVFKTNQIRALVIPEDEFYQKTGIHFEEWFPLYQENKKGTKLSEEDIKTFNKGMPFVIDYYKNSTLAKLWDELEENQREKTTLETNLEAAKKETGALRSKLNKLQEDYKRKDEEVAKRENYVKHKDEELSKLGAKIEEKEKRADEILGREEAVKALELDYQNKFSELGAKEKELQDTANSLEEKTNFLVDKINGVQEIEQNLNKREDGLNKRDKRYEAVRQEIKEDQKKVVEELENRIAYLEEKLERDEKLPETEAIQLLKEEKKTLENQLERTNKGGVALFKYISADYDKKLEEEVANIKKEFEDDYELIFSEIGKTALLDTLYLSTRDLAQTAPEKALKLIKALEKREGVNSKVLLTCKAMAYETQKDFEAAVNTLRAVASSSNVTNPFLEDFTKTTANVCIELGQFFETVIDACNNLGGAEYTAKKAYALYQLSKEKDDPAKFREALDSLEAALKEDPDVLSQIKNTGLLEVLNKLENFDKERFEKAREKDKPAEQTSEIPEPTGAPAPGTGKAPAMAPPKTATRNPFLKKKKVFTKRKIVTIPESVENNTKESGGLIFVKARIGFSDKWYRVDTNGDFLDETGDTVLGVEYKRKELANHYSAGVEYQHGSKNNEELVDFILEDDLEELTAKEKVVDKALDLALKEMEEKPAEKASEDISKRISDIINKEPADVNICPNCGTSVQPSWFLCPKCRNPLP